MGIVYGLLALLFALVIGLCILVVKYRSDYKINNDYVKECEENWSAAIGLCRKVCERNEELVNQYGKEDHV